MIAAFAFQSFGYTIDQMTLSLREPHLTMDYRVRKLPAFNLRLPEEPLKVIPYVDLGSLGKYPQVCISLRVTSNVSEALSIYKQKLLCLLFSFFGKVT